VSYQNLNSLKIEDYARFIGGSKDERRKKCGHSFVIGSKDPKLLKYEWGAISVEH